MVNTLPVDSKERKNYPVGEGALAYFPAAIAGVAYHSYVAGAKYNDGGLVHKRWMSNDHSNCIERHLMDLRDLEAAKKRGVTTWNVLFWNFELKIEELKSISIDEAILIECNALCWRALAFSQERYEKLRGVPLAPAAQLESQINDAVVLAKKPVEVVKIFNHQAKDYTRISEAIKEIAGTNDSETTQIMNKQPIEVPLIHMTFHEARLLLGQAGAMI